MIAPDTGEALRALRRLFGEAWIGGTTLNRWVALGPEYGGATLTRSQCADVAEALLTVASALEQGRPIEPEEDE